MTEHVRVGIIGCGNITSTIHLPILMNMPRVKVAFLADVQPPLALARDFDTRAFGIDQISSLPDCDMVFVATPVGARADYIRQFGGRGIFVFTEKPFAMNSAQHAEYLEVASNISCNYMKTTHGAIRQLKDIVATKLFGELRRVEVREGGIVGATGKSHSHYQTNVTLSGGGILMERGCHTLSQLDFVLEGFKFDVAEAEISWLGDLDIDVRSTIKCTTDGTFDLTYHVSQIRPIGNRAVFEFDTAIVDFDHTNPASQVRIAPRNGGSTYLLESDASMASSIIQSFFLKWDWVVKRVCAGRCDRFSGRDVDCHIAIDRVHIHGGRTKDMKKIAIIGANGRVGTELCFYLRGEPGIEVVPVVRNIMGAAFLIDQGFECRVFDICDESQARSGLEDIDVVVISSFVFRAGSESQRLNTAMIDHSIQSSKQSSKIIYLSTVRALAWRVDRGTPRFAVPRSYDRNKRLLEKHLLKACEGTGKTGIALRLGHVYGKNQPRTAALQEMLRAGKPLELRVDPDSASNVVHTATIANCIDVCTRSSVKQGVYSLVNVPQWSWRRVFEYYNEKGTEVMFRSASKISVPLHRRFIGKFWKFVASHRETFAELRQFTPPTLERKIQRRFSIRNAATEIAAVVAARKGVVEMREFRYRPMPATYVPGMSESSQLLDHEKLPADVFV